MSAPIAFGCAAEITPLWVQRVERLAWSLRTFGGASADAEFHACFAGPVEERLVGPLRELDVTVHRVPRFDARLSYANKLRLLELGDHLGADVEAVVMIDCDVVFTGDPGPLLPADRVAAKPADRDPLQLDAWRRLCAAMGIPVPARDVVATATGRPMPRYYNSGVVVVPRGQQASMQESWARWLGRVVDLLADDPEIVPQARRIFADQYALMAAMAEHDGVALPTEANCPTHLRMHQAAAPARPPAILHYHDRMWGNGLLQRPVDVTARSAAAAFNAAWAQAQDLPDPGLYPPPVRARVSTSVARVREGVRASRSFTRLRTSVVGARSSRVA